MGPEGSVSSPQQLFGGVPSSGQQSQGGEGGSANSLLDQLVQPINPELIKAAMTPIPGGHQIDMPSSMTTPIQPFQQRPMNQQPVVGKGNARARGIGNAIRGVTNAVGSIVNAEAEKKQTAIAVSTHRLIDAQNAIDQAQEVLKNDPNNADAKKSLDHNTKISEAILADPKLRKSLEKGFQINFTDPQQNNTPDHKAVQQGIQMAKDGQQQQQQPTFTEQFRGQMPRTMMDNTVAQRQLQLQQDQQKLGTQIFKAYMPAIVANQKFGQAQALLQTRQIFQAQLAHAKAVQQFTLQTLKMQQVQDMQAKKFAHDFGMEATRQRDRISAINIAVQAHEGNPVVIQNMMEKENHAYENEKNQRETRMTALDSQISSLVSNPNQNDEIKGRIKELKDMRQQLQDGFKQLDSAHAGAVKAIQDIIPEEKNAKPTSTGSGSSVPKSATGEDEGSEDNDSSDQFDGSSDDPLSYIFSDTGDN